MNAQDQVCSFELAKELKKLGITERSMFSWQINLEGHFYLNISFMGSPGADDVPAFTAAELGEMIPPQYFSFWKLGDKYFFHKTDSPHLMDKNLANAMAKVVIYLIENKLTLRI